LFLPIILLFHVAVADHCRSVLDQCETDDQGEDAQKSSKKSAEIASAALWLCLKTETQTWRLKN